MPKSIRKPSRPLRREANVTMMAEYDHKNPAALSKLLQAGVKLQAYPKDVLEAAYKAAQDLYADEAGRTRPSRKSTPSGINTGKRRMRGSVLLKHAWITSCNRISNPEVSSQKTASFRGFFTSIFVIKTMVKRFLPRLDKLPGLDRIRG